jgi:cation-transporting ATPase 13A3/4/5
MENKLKPETVGAVEILKNAEVRVVMATGDNILTATSVARQCKIIDENKKTLMGDLVEQEGKPAEIKWTDVSKNTNEPSSPRVDLMNIDEVKKDLNKI